MHDVNHEIQFRSVESGVPQPVLKTVYLRAMNASSASVDDALARMDEFIVYALERDTRYSRDRDLVEFVPTA